MTTLRFLFTRLLLLPLLLLPAGAFAVSLGDELILSRLGDPVEVEIDVLQWEDLDLERVQISAASREEYDVFKLTWLPVLEHLDFNLVGPDLNGKVRVLVSSRDPLDEPFLELLLVLRWPGGSLRREYVLLFDPPGAPVALAPAQEPEPQIVAFVAPPEPTVNEGDPAPVGFVQTEQGAAPEPPAVEAESRAAAVETPLPAVPEPQVVPEAGPDLAIAPEPPAPALPEPLPEPPAPALPESAPEPPAPAPSEPAIAVQQTPPPPAPVATAPAAPPAPPAPVLPEPDDEDDAPPVADARTQVAIEVDTLAPRAPAPLLDTPRRTYQVRPGDSLWNIARQFLPAGAADNLYQMLLGIHDLNRGAFINGNISLLRASALLQLPSEADIAAIDPETAEAEFDRRWETGTQRVEAAQRGEAIPLFAEVEPEEPVLPAEPELPPGVEVPPPVDDNGLIMVSATNGPLPLQLAPSLQGMVDAASASSQPESSEVVTGSSATVATADDSAATNAASSATPAIQAATITTTNVSAVTELETELAAMRARRERAEALARELQESLQRVQAERAAQSALFSHDNLPLAGGALALLAALIAGVVFMLKVAGELRTVRHNAASARTLQGGPARIDARPATREPRRMEAARVEPSIGMTNPAASRTNAPDASRIEVIELATTDAESATGQATPASSEHSADAPAPGEAPPRSEPTDPDDLFARMDDMLGTSQKSPQK